MLADQLASGQQVCILLPQHFALALALPTNALANCAFVSRVDWSYPADGATDVPTIWEVQLLAD